MTAQVHDLKHVIAGFVASNEAIGKAVAHDIAEATHRGKAHGVSDADMADILEPFTANQAAAMALLAKVKAVA